jgi:hypothetical protein
MAPPYIKRSAIWPDPRVKPPFGSVEIDWSHPLARGLAGCWLFNEVAGLPFDLVTQRTVAAPPSFAHLQWGSGAGGPYLVNLRNFDWVVRTPLDTLYDVTSQSMSVVLDLYPNVGDANTGAALISHGLSSVDGWRLQLRGSQDLNFVTSQSGVNQQTGTNSSPLVFGRANRCIATRSGSTAHIYADGVEPTYAFQQSHLDPTSNPARQMCLGGDENISGGIGDGIAGALFYLNRVLSPDDAVWLSEEPYAFLRPIVRRRYSIPPPLPSFDADLFQDFPLLAYFPTEETPSSSRSRTYAIAAEWARKLSAQEATPAEWVRALSRANKIPVEWLGVLTSRRTLPVEWGLRLTGRDTLPVEWVRGLTARDTLPAEWLGPLLARDTIPVESGVRLLARDAIPTEWTARSTQLRKIPAEWTASLLARDTIPVESGVLFVRRDAVPSEWNARLARQETIPTEWGTRLTQRELILAEWFRIEVESILLADYPFLAYFATRDAPSLAVPPTPVSRRQNIPVESLGALTRDDTIPSEWVSALTRAEKILAEWGVRLTARDAIPVESLGALTARDTILSEWTARLTRQETIPTEWGTRITRGDLILAEWVRVTSRRNAIPAEWLGALTARDIIPSEWTRAIARVEHVLAEWGLRLTPRNAIPAEWLGALMARDTIPSEWTRAVSRIENVLAEWGVRLTSRDTLPAENLGALTARDTVPVESLTSPTRREALPTEWVSSLVARDTIPVESGVRLLARDASPVEWFGFLTRRDTVLAEWVSLLTARDTLPVESGVDLLARDTTPVESLGALTRPETIPVDSLGASTRGYTIPGEWVCIRSRRFTIPGEWITRSALTALQAIPVEWVRALLAGDSVPVETKPPFVLRLKAHIVVEWQATVSPVVVDVVYGGGGPVWPAKTYPKIPPAIYERVGAAVLRIDTRGLVRRLPIVVPSEVPEPAITNVVRGNARLPMHTKGEVDFDQYIGIAREEDDLLLAFFTE